MNFSKLNIHNTLTHIEWICIGELGDPVVSFHFTGDGKLIKAINGNTNILNYELLDANKIHISQNNHGEIFDFHYLKYPYLILKKNSSDQYCFLVAYQSTSTKFLQINEHKKLLEQTLFSNSNDGFTKKECPYCSYLGVNSLGQCPNCLNKLY